jgi:phospholipase C
LEKWTAAIGKPAHCPNISAWRRSVCGDLTGAFDFASPVYGLPELPATTVIGDPQGGAYHPPVTSNAMPAQEPGVKRARALPYQPNANLDGFTGASAATLSFSNIGPHVRKAAHFAVYDNTVSGQTLVGAQAGMPTQHTVAPGHTDRATVPVTGRYDLTVVGPNRFLRHFTGDVTAAGRTARVTATYGPQLVLDLANEGGEPVTFTVVSNHYAHVPARTHRVPAHGSRTHVVDPVAASNGWYDLTVTVSGDPSWTRRYVGHIEDGRDSVTG